MSKKLHIDIETFSSIPIMTAGAYKYCESPDFEILILAYAFDQDPISVIDLAQGEKMPKDFIDGLLDPSIEKHAHNANFERNCFKAIGYDVPTEQWHCSAIKAGYCGLPLSLAGVSQALQLEEKGKLATGKALIRFFSCPVKPTKRNGMQTRNLPSQDLEKWEEYKLYCANDVEAEREATKILAGYKMPETERLNYILDQKINDKGILVDLEFAQSAVDIDTINAKIVKDELKKLTGLENPNSPAQLKGWLCEAMGKNEIPSLAKDIIPDLIKEAGPGVVSVVLGLRKRAAKTSIKKYTAMLNCAGEDSRARGLFQFYGANRTGRWAGRLIQLQNLPRNYITDLDVARKVVKSGDYDTLKTMYADVSNVLSQSIRTAFIAKPGFLFAVSDFSAIEARVIAWLANESWRLDVFNSHGKIYEASAAVMFGVPLESIGKGSPLREKGKIAELALGYQGAVGALKQMGGEKMGLSDSEMKEIVSKWRSNNPAIVQLWKTVDRAAIRCVTLRKSIKLKNFKGLVFEYDGRAMTIELPSGRKLYYQTPKLTKNDWGQDAIKYMGMDQTTKTWGWIDSYGGKFVENIVQAIARDLLSDSMLRLDKNGFDIVMHVHDEAVAEVPKEKAADKLRDMFDIMGETVDWAPGLPLTADGYVTPFYKKD